MSDITYTPVSSGSSSRVTGEIISGLWATAPSGWLKLDGSTIGDASSGASYANADAVNLFSYFWENVANTECPVSGGRGASAAADFAAHKTLTILDAGGYTLVQRGGTSLNGAVGTTVGAETHTLDTTEMPTHSHSYTATGTGTSSLQSGADVEIGTESTSEEGGSEPHNNIQPSLIVSGFFVKL